jgi:5'-nucleotidase
LKEYSVTNNRNLERTNATSHRKNIGLLKFGYFLINSYTYTTIKEKLISLLTFAIISTKMEDQPTIMVTNDDGIDAPGLRALVQVLVSTRRFQVLVCAPDSCVLSISEII